MAELVIGSWRKLHGEGLHNVYDSRILSEYKVRKDRMGGICRTHGGENGIQITKICRLTSGAVTLWETRA
jgi:hypothetical protein